MNQLKLGQSKSGQNKLKTSGQNDKKKSMINFNLGQKSEQKLGEKKIQQGQRWTLKQNQDEKKIPDIKNQFNSKQ